MCDVYKNKSISLTGEKLEKLKKYHDVHLEKAEPLENTLKNDPAEAKTNLVFEKLTFDFQKMHPPSSDSIIFTTLVFKLVALIKKFLNRKCHKQVHTGSWILLKNFLKNTSKLR